MILLVQFLPILCAMSLWSLKSSLSSVPACWASCKVCLITSLVRMLLSVLFSIVYGDQRCPTIRPCLISSVARAPGLGQRIMVLTGNVKISPSLKIFTARESSLFVVPSRFCFCSRSPLCPSRQPSISIFPAPIEHQRPCPTMLPMNKTSPQPLQVRL